MNPTPDSPAPAAVHRWSRAQAWVGQPVEAIETPALVIDLDAMERNLERMAAFARTQGLRLRPHAKTHKSGELALLQMSSGAAGVCVQKVDEAMALALTGVTQIFITNEVIAMPKLERLAAAVVTNTTRFAIAIDSELGIENLVVALAQAGVHQPEAIDVFLEIDVGHGRCGVDTAESAVALARRIATHPCLRFAGLQAYQGAAQHLRTVTSRNEALAVAANKVQETKALLETHGIAAPLVSGAGTGSFVRESQGGLWGELQVGSYLFMDADYAANEADPLSPKFEHALFVKSQVMSRSPGHAVCDAGHKSHAIDSGLPTVAHPPHLRFANGGDEHGVLHADEVSALPKLGDTVWLVPGHCDPTVNLHDFYVGVRGGILGGRIERIIRIDARGATG